MIPLRVKSGIQLLLFGVLSGQSRHAALLDFNLVVLSAKALFVLALFWFGKRIYEVD